MLTGYMYIRTNIGILEGKVVEFDNYYTLYAKGKLIPLKKDKYLFEYMLSNNPLENALIKLNSNDKEPLIITKDDFGTVIDGNKVILLGKDSIKAKCIFYRAVIRHEIKASPKEIYSRIRDVEIRSR